MREEDEWMYKEIRNNFLKSYLDFHIHLEEIMQENK